VHSVGVDRAYASAIFCFFPLREKGKEKLERRKGKRYLCYNFLVIGGWAERERGRNI
jgi:hypothetical protein